MREFVSDRKKRDSARFEFRGEKKRRRDVPKQSRSCRVRNRRATGDASARARHPSRDSRWLDGDVTAVDRARGDAVRARARVGSDKLSIRRGRIEMVARPSPL